MSIAISELHGDAAAYAHQTSELSQSVLVLRGCAEEHVSAGKALKSVQDRLSAALAAGASGRDELVELEEAADRVRAMEVRLEALLEAFQS